MSLETRLRTALLAECDRVFADAAPADAALPYVIWQQIGGAAPTYLERDTPSVRNAEVQVSVWAATRAQANALALLLEEVLVADTTLQAKPVAALIARHDPDMQLYGTMQDFSIWADR